MNGTLQLHGEAAPWAHVGPERSSSTQEIKGVAW